MKFPPFPSHLKIFIANFDKSPTFHARINHHWCEITSLSRGSNELAGLEGGEQEEWGRLKTLINNKGGGRVVKHFCRNYPPSRFLDEIFSRVWKRGWNNYNGVEITLRAKKVSILFVLSRQLFSI